MESQKTGLLIHPFGSDGTSRPAYDYDYWVKIQTKISTGWPVGTTVIGVILPVTHKQQTGNIHHGEHQAVN